MGGSDVQERDVCVDDSVGFGYVGVVVEESRRDEGLVVAEMLS